MAGKALSLALIGLGMLSMLTVVAWAGEGQEERVTLEQVPPAVKATILQESAGGEITAIERETKDGQTIYEAEVKLNGKEIDITVAADGYVEVSLASENGSVVFSTRNTGSTLAEDEAHRVFERFWRADPSHRTAQQNHCGLGLPLCQAVSVRLGGSLEVTTSPTTGVFEVTFRLPAADTNHHRPK